MLDFYSASVRIANSERAVDECMEIMFEGKEPKDCRAVIINGAMGHKLDKVAAAVKKHVPDAAVLATSCGGIIGREGAGEALTHLAMMAVCGPESECDYAVIDEIYANNAYDKALELAKDLKQKQPEAKIVYLICPGINIACDDVLSAFDDVLGDDVLVFGGTSADNYKAITTYQYIDNKLTEHGAFAIGFSDKTLKAIAKASHGFHAYGEKMTVTKAKGNEIIEIDGLPAWVAYGNRMSLVPDEKDSKMLVIAAGGMAKELSEELAQEYGNSHILRGAVMGKSQGVMYMSTTVDEGDEFWLTTRDEDLIFSAQKVALEYLNNGLDGHEPIAVFQADCLARGRTLFNKVMKDELIGMMQEALKSGDEVPPWLGMYGFGEFCTLGGRNTFHTYTTSLMVLYR